MGSESYRSIKLGLVLTHNHRASTGRAAYGSPDVVVSSRIHSHPVINKSVLTSLPKSGMRSGMRAGSRATLSLEAVHQRDCTTCSAFNRLRGRGGVLVQVEAQAQVEAMADHATSSRTKPPSAQPDCVLW